PWFFRSLLGHWAPRDSSEPPGQGVPSPATGSSGLPGVACITRNVTSHGEDGGYQPEQAADGVSEQEPRPHDPRSQHAPWRTDKRGRGWLSPAAGRFLD